MRAELAARPAVPETWIPEEEDTSGYVIRLRLTAKSDPSPDLVINLINVVSRFAMVLGVRRRPGAVDLLPAGRARNIVKAAEELRNEPEVETVELTIE